MTIWASLAAPQVVATTTCEAASVDKVGIVTTLGFQSIEYILLS